MKIFSKQDVHQKIKRDNDLLIQDNLRLRKKNETLHKSNTGIDYNKAEQDFKKFIAEINDKRQKMLLELEELQKAIDLRKDIYYGLVEKQDILEERIYKLEQKEKQLDARERFVNQLETNFNNMAYEKS